MVNKKKIKIFDIVLVIIFVLICFLIIIPIWKILVDSVDLKTAYGMRLFPQKFGWDGYKSVFTNPTLYRPLMISFFTTISGTFCGLALSTLGGYVLIQKDMPGKSLMSGFLLFTMIFNGGMIPTFLVLRALGLTNTLAVVILLPAISVYNLVLMRNFFEGIPESLFEAAEIDGASHMKIFFSIVLPLSKAALASIGLFYAVSYWNDYTNYRLYIQKSDLYNFQMKLRSIMQGSDLPQALGSATENTVRSACIIIALLPFMVLYPFLQQYFVTGVNIGAVKG
ncbi:MAG: carbohydrate ABC transporter permease [Eubacterium sp.]|nr:carbohydrate ABC transporter permease [Eubacterium sp.]MCM1304446.1 carbohydrate ABC transporter permease [Butyrivibrio sp.]MCM1343901.1 carbohydrate ABC transporter permease [Muribaculaceae bacterium]MCM1408939.1 carbohydrate ABC transporter permease [Lachnospiraceae bacterium]